MSISNSILHKLSKKTLARNARFLMAEKSEKCFIFGNGDSLKNYNFKNFSIYPTIGCNSLFLHNDFKYLDCRYYFIPAPYMFYPYRRFYNKIYRNTFASLYKAKILSNQSTNFFINLADRFAFSSPNTHYCYHFNSKRSYDLAGSFSYLNSSLHSMIAGAIYMGFKEVILVGCDYLFSPPRSGHFFEKNKGVEISNIEYLHSSLDDEFSSFIKIKCMVHENITSSFESVSYESFFNNEEKTSHQENSNIVDYETLKILDKLFYKTL